MRIPAFTIALALAVLGALAPGALAAPHLTQIGSFDTPVYITAPPGDPHRLFVVEKAGRIQEIRDGQRLSPAFLDIVRDVVSGGERGLLSMAFAPDYATSHRFYIYYTAPRPGDANGSIITIQELKTLPGNPDAVDPASRRTIATVDHPTNPNHDGGQLQFGPDGQLYAATGDGGSGNDPPNNAQNPAVQLGKLLRVDTAAGGASIVAMGLRNPWRFSFDRQTGDLVIADVGQGAYEEVNFTPAGTADGLNYGWRCFEGFHRTSNACTTTTGMTPPVLEKDHANDGFCAIVGGYVVRDPALAPLTGRYVYGDNCGTQIRSAALVAPPARVTDDSDTGMRVNALTSFGEDSCGHVYATSGAGPVYRLDGSAFTPCPGAGSGPGGGTPTPADTRAPRLALGGKSRQRVLRQRGLRVAVSCGERCGASIGGTWRIGKSRVRRRLKAVTRQLAANRRTQVTLRLSKHQRRLIAAALRHRRSVRFTVRATARDAARNAATKSKVIRARR